MKFELIFIYILVFFSLFNLSLMLIAILEKPFKRKPYKLNKNLPRVAIIVPAYNEEKNISSTLKNLLKLKYPKEKLEIIVVDDGSKDKTFEKAKKFEKYNVKVYRKPNGGKGSALNYGIKRTKAEFIATLDADSFPEKDSLLKMLPYFEDKKVMAVTPAMVVHKPRNFIERLQHAEYLFGIFLRKVFANINAIHVCPGPLSIYRRKFFEKHGLFDEKNLTEDMEMAMRIQKYGYKIETAVDSKVSTIAPKNFKGLLKQRERWYTGYIHNCIKHKQLFKIPQYEFLSLILIFAYLSIILTFGYLSYISFKNYQLIRDNFRALRLVGFDILGPEHINRIEIIEFLSHYFSNPFVLLGLFGLSATLLIFLIVKKETREEKVFLNTFFFIFFYSFFYSLFWLVVFFKYITRRKVKW